MNTTTSDWTAQVVASLRGLEGRGQHELAAKLGQLTSVIAEEAARTPRFRTALAAALSDPRPAAQTAPAAPARPRAAARSTRRAPALFDPVEVYRADGEAGLRAKLVTLDDKQLKDIIAEQGMDPARQTVRWRTAKLTGRIMDMVIARTEKGSAFRD